MRLLLHQNRRKPSLKEMPHPFIAPVVYLGIATVELPHAQRQIGLRRFNEEMVVIVHQAVGMAAPAVAIDHMGEEGEPLRPITVVRHDVLPGIPPTGDMVDGPRIFNAQRTGHGAGV